MPGITDDDLRYVPPPFVELPPEQHMDVKDIIDLLAGGFSFPPECDARQDRDESVA